MNDPMEQAPRWEQHKWTVFGAALVLVAAFVWLKAFFVHDPVPEKVTDEHQEVGQLVPDRTYAERTEAERRRVEEEARRRAEEEERKRREQELNELRRRTQEQRSAEKKIDLNEALLTLVKSEIDTLGKPASGSPTAERPMQTPKQAALSELEQEKHRADQMHAEAEECLSKAQAGDYRCAQAFGAKNGFVPGQAGFMQRTAAQGSGTSQDPYIVQSGRGLPLPPGTKIVTTLDQDMTSDLLGPFSVTVSGNVYDPSGRYVLIPDGATLVGQSAEAQSVNELIAPRMNSKLTWLTYPDGRSLDLSKHAAVLDATGKTGIPGEMDWHAGTIAAGALISLLFSSPGYMLESGGQILGPRQAALNGLASTANSTGQRIAQKYLSVNPSKTPAAGEPLIIMIQAPLSLPAFEPVDKTAYTVGGQP